MKKENQIYKVRITNKKHPHFDETGVLEDKIIYVVGKPMIRVKLDNCIHGTDACFCKKTDFKLRKNQ